MELFIVILIIEVLINGVISCCVLQDEGAILPKTPKDLYKRYDNLNWFGACFIYFLYCIGVPIIALVRFIMYLCTVGRN